MLNANGEKLKAATEQLTGGDRPTFDVALERLEPDDFLFGLGVGDGTVGVAAGAVAGNAETIYQLDGDPALTPDETSVER